MTPFELEAIRLSLSVAITAVIVGLPLAIIVAWILARSQFPGKSVLDGIVHLPLILPPVVVGYLLLISFGRNGPFGSVLYEWFGITVVFDWKGAVVAAAVMAFPLMVRAIRLSLEAVDSGLESAARTLGASQAKVLLTITLPLTAPGILSAAILGFARSLGEFGATITFVSNIPGETQTLPIALYSLTQVPGGEDGATRLVVIAILIAFASILASEVLARRLKARLGQ